MGVYVSTNPLKNDFGSRLWKAIIKIFKIFAFGRKGKGFTIYSPENVIDSRGVKVWQCIRLYFPWVVDTDLLAASSPMIPEAPGLLIRGVGAWLNWRSRHIIPWTAVVSPRVSQSEYFLRVLLGYMVGEGSILSLWSQGYKDESPESNMGGGMEWCQVMFKCQVLPIPVANTNQDIPIVLLCRPMYSS